MSNLKNYELFYIIGGTIIFDNFLIANNSHDWMFFYTETGDITITQCIFKNNSLLGILTVYPITDSNIINFVINQTYFESNSIFYGFTFYQISKMNFFLYNAYFVETEVFFLFFLNVLGKNSYFEIQNSVFIDTYNEDQLIAFQTGNEDNYDMLSHSKINKTLFFSTQPLLNQKIKFSQINIEGKIRNILNQIYFVNIRCDYNIGCLRVLNYKLIEGQYTFVNNSVFLNIFGDDYYFYEKYVGSPTLNIKAYQDIFINNCLFKNNEIKAKTLSFKGAPCIYSEMPQGILFINGSLFESNKAMGSLASCILFFGNVLLVENSNFLGHSFTSNENDDKNYGVLCFTNGENFTLKDTIFFKNKGSMISVFSIISNKFICFINLNGLKVLNNTSDELQIYIRVYAYALNANYSNFLYNQNGPKGSLITFTNEGKLNLSDILITNCLMLFNLGDHVSLAEFNVYYTNLSFQSSIFSSNKGLCFLFLSDFSSIFSFDYCVFTNNIAQKIGIFNCFLGNIYINNSRLEENYVNLGSK